MTRPMKVTRHFGRKRIDDDMLRVLWASRLPEYLIVKRLGHSRGTIRRRAIKLGLPSSRRELWELE